MLIVQVLVVFDVEPRRHVVGTYFSETVKSKLKSGNPGQSLQEISRRVFQWWNFEGFERWSADL